MELSGGGCPRDLRQAVVQRALEDGVQSPPHSLRPALAASPQATL